MGDLSLDQLTLAALLTTAGATSLAAIVTGLVAVLGRLIPAIGGHEAQAAAVLAAVFVALLAVQAVATGATPVDVRLVLLVVLAWYAVTRLAMSIYDDVTGQRAGFRAQATGAPPAPPAD